MSYIYTKFLAIHTTNDVHLQFLMESDIFTYIYSIHTHTIYRDIGKNKIYSLIQHARPYLKYSIMEFLDGFFVAAGVFVQKKKIIVLYVLDTTTMLNFSIRFSILFNIYMVRRAHATSLFYYRGYIHIHKKYIKDESFSKAFPIHTQT